MGKLLKLEWLKVRKYRAFMILVAFYIVSIFGINLIVSNAIADRPTAGNMDVVGMLVGTPFDFPQVWQTVSFLGSFLLIIPGFIMIFLMSNEYSFRTGRQNVIDGVSKAQFIDTKIALILVISLALTLLTFLTGVLFGLAGDTPFSFEGIEYLGYFFVNAASYMSVALVIVILLKRSGVSIGIYFLYSFIVENLLGLIINKKIWEDAGNFLPLESADKLIPMPSSIGKIMNPTEIEPIYFLAAAVIWIAACLMFCKYHFQKSDLK